MVNTWDTAFDSPGARVSSRISNEHWIKYLLCCLCVMGAGCQASYSPRAAVAEAGGETDDGADDDKATDDVDADLPEEGFVDGVPDVNGWGDAAMDAPDDALSELDAAQLDADTSTPPDDVPDAANMADTDEDAASSDTASDAIGLDDVTDVDEDAPPSTGEDRMIWGQPIDGSLTVEVVDIYGRPIDDAFVQVGLDTATGQTGRTDAEGLASFASDDLIGEQTITATTPRHAAMTYWGVESDHVRMELRVRDPATVELPRGSVYVQVIAQGLTPVPRGWVRRYGASLTVPRGARRTAPVARQSFNNSNSHWLTGQPGPCAVVVMVGDQQDATVSPQFRPLLMGVQAVNIAAGEDVSISVVADIPVDAPREVVLPADAGWYSGIQDTITISALLDLGPLGLASQPFMVTPASTTHGTVRVPSPVDALADAEIEYRVAYSNQGQAPVTVVKQRLPLISGDPVVFDEPVAVAQVSSPFSDGTLLNSAFSFMTHPHGHVPDLYRLEVFSETTNTSRWDFIGPGRMAHLPVPTVLGMETWSDLGDATPDTSGSLDFHVYSVYSPLVRYHDLSWLMLDGDGWQSYVWDRHRIAF